MLDRLPAGFLHFLYYAGVLLLSPCYPALCLLLRLRRWRTGGESGCGAERGFSLGWLLGRGRCDSDGGSSYRNSPMFLPRGLSRQLTLTQRLPVLHFGAEPRRRLNLHSFACLRLPAELLAALGFLIVVFGLLRAPAQHAISGGRRDDGVFLSRRASGFSVTFDPYMVAAMAKRRSALRERHRQSWDTAIALLHRPQVFLLLQPDNKLLLDGYFRQPSPLITLMRPVYPLRCFWTDIIQGSVGQRRERVYFVAKESQFCHAILPEKLVGNQQL